MIDYMCDEQKRYNKTDNDLLGILAVVSKGPMQDEQQME